MPPTLHRFEHDGRRYVIDPETCFCFECDAISWDVLEHYPRTPVNRIYHLLRERHPEKELGEVVGELEWLRVTKSILPPPKDASADMRVERGLRMLFVQLPAPPDAEVESVRRWFKRGGTAAPTAAEFAREAAQLLLARSGPHQSLELKLALPEAAPSEAAAQLAPALEEAFRLARLAGKELCVGVTLPKLEPASLPGSLEGHRLSATLELREQVDAALLRKFAGAAGLSLARLAAVCKPSAEQTLRLVVSPRHPGYGGAIAALEQAGFTLMELDLDDAFAAMPEADAAAMMGAMHENAVYYAERLLAGTYYRVDPIAELFRRIHLGEPQPRTDPIGTNAWALDATGGIYPDPRFFGQEAFLLGTLQNGEIATDAVKQFDDVGARTTASCLRCWARNLCGGGTAVVHHARSGSFRQPETAWCDAQRAWLHAAVAAFSVLSGAGVNFSRTYAHFGHSKRPSLLTLARAALQMHVGLRPIEEADAEWLIRWENWNEAAYFTCHESGVLLATHYDREMDALHPRGIEQEFVLTTRSGGTLGLLKLRPEHLPRTARAWFYLRDEASCHAETVRKGVRHLVRQAAENQAIDTVLTPVGPKEDALAGFLEAVGFQHIGTEREALYLHGAYHDVRIFALQLKQA